MKNLKVWQKLTLLGVLFLIPFALVTYKMVSSINSEKVQFAQLELMGTEYDAPLTALLKDLQQHASMAAVWLGGDASFKDGVSAKGADIEGDIARVDAVDQRLNAALDTSKKWSELRTAIRDLLGKTASLSASDSLDQHQKVIDATLTLITNVSDNSKLTLDPDTDTYYLMNALMFMAPTTSDFMAQARTHCCSMASRKIGTPDEFENLSRLAILADNEQVSAGVDDSLSRVFEYSKTHDQAVISELQSQAQANTAAVKAITDTLKNLVASRKLDASSADYYASMTKNIDPIFDLQGHVRDTLNRRLNIRIADWQNQINTTLGVCALMLLAVLVVGFFIMRDITAPLQDAIIIANHIAAGDVNVSAVVANRTDEVGSLLQAFNRMTTSLKETVAMADQISAGNLAVKIKPRSDRDAISMAFGAMIEKLSVLVGQVQKSGIQVNTSTTEIAATAKQQQATATEIAATTTEISATSKEITATSKELVRTMNQVSTGADQSATLAGSGQAGLARMEETMRHVMEAATSINARLAVLNEKAGNINQVVTTITKVADQTNLLSLNAAIEAEKAGEYGRGFAVVATEIRRLADQTAVATYDIEQMVKEIQSAVSAGVMGMDKFSEEVRRGMQEVQQVGGQLSQIIQEVQALAPRFEMVNEGMQAQATGAEQITEALSQLSEAAQQTVDSLRQSNQVIDGLNQASVGLRSSVSRFKLEE